LTKYQRAWAKILLVEDDQRLLAVLKERFESMGCWCVACSNAGEALVNYAAGDFDLIVTDLVLPSVDGLSIVGLIRDESQIPIVVITGHSADYGRLLNRFQDVSLVTKPFDPRQLMRTVRSLVLGDTPDPNAPPRAA
jgi:DNA-binding response OmpR family regulator